MQWLLQEIYKAIQMYLWSLDREKKDRAEESYIKIITDIRIVSNL